MRVVCSDSAGCVSVLSLAEGALTSLSQWKAHDFESWISAFSYWDTQLVYSGNTHTSLVSADKFLNENSPALPHFTAYFQETKVKEYQYVNGIQCVLSKNGKQLLNITDNKVLFCFFT